MNFSLRRKATSIWDDYNDVTFRDGADVADVWCRIHLLAKGTAATGIASAGKSVVDGNVSTNVPWGFHTIN